jgi:hypothetical protein
MLGSSGTIGGAELDDGKGELTAGREGVATNAGVAGGTTGSAIAADGEGTFKGGGDGTGPGEDATGAGLPDPSPCNFLIIVAARFLTPSSESLRTGSRQLIFSETGIAGRLTSCSIDMHLTSAEIERRF